MIALSILAFLTKIIFVPQIETETLLKTVVFPSKMMSFIVGKLHMKVLDHLERKAQEVLGCAGLGLWTEDGSEGLDWRVFYPEVRDENTGLPGKV